MTAASTKAKTVTVELALTKDTPNTVRYDEVKDDAQPSQMRTVYLQTHVAAALGNPAKILVTVQASA